jgi:hypothetical protein
MARATWERLADKLFEVTVFVILVLCYCVAGVILATRFVRRVFIKSNSQKGGKNE